jgi:phosphoglycolate phosphatase
MSKFELVIFDLDGTLVDSKADIIYCFNQSLSKFGIEALPEELIAKHVGTGIRPLLKEVFANYPKTTLSELTQEFESLYSKNLTKQTKLYPGMLEILLQCQSKKAVLTNKMQVFADMMIDQLNLREYFVGVFGRDAFDTCKPDPLPVFKVCEKFNMNLQKTIIIGDTETDIKTGKNSEIATCGVLYGYGNQSEIVASRPDFIVNAVKDLRSIIF